MKSLQIENASLRDTLHLHAKITVYGFLVGACIIVLLGVAVVWSYLQPRGLPSCTSLGSYANVQSYIKSHPASLKRLDRNNDGIPCNEQYYFSQG